jgi:5-methylcytosine-specific restriction enzyme subunit McrC
MITRDITIVEYETARLDPNELPPDAGERIWREHGSKISVEFPSPRTGGWWLIRSLGWAGIISVGEEIRLTILPRDGLRSLFAMLEYAYRLKSFHLYRGLVGCGSIEEFYSELAAVLARALLERSRRGLVRGYVPRSAALGYLRGQLDIARHSRGEDPRHLPCRFQEQSHDIPENRIVLAALSAIERSGLVSERVLPIVRRARRQLAGVVSEVGVAPADFTRIAYSRLNEDYAMMHALSRFFLEGSGPTFPANGRSVPPFLVDMAYLFEMFVAEWLRAHLPAGLLLQTQSRLSPTGDHPLHFRVDILIADAIDGRPRVVIDTKYKGDGSIDSSDVAQVVTYAEATGCHDAILLYPREPSPPMDIRVGEIRVRAIGFAIDGDLDAAGLEVLRRVVGRGRGDGGRRDGGMIRET